MGKGLAMFQKFIFKMFMQMLASASPEIVEGIREGVQKMVVKARETPNPWDDMFTGLLQMLVGAPKEPVDPDGGDP